MKPGAHAVLLGGHEAALMARGEGLTVRDSFMLLWGNRTLVAWLVRAPLEGSIVEAAINHSSRGLAIDASRVETSDDLGRMNVVGPNGQFNPAGGPSRATYDPIAASGRWPSNLLLVHGAGCLGGECEVECPVARMDTPSRFYPTFSTLAEAVTWIATLAEA